MVGIAKGDTRAFEALYRRYERRLYHYLRTLVQNDSTVEELVVEVMMAVWNGAATFHAASRLSTWIFGIARHKALDAVRKSGRPIEQTVPLDDALDHPDQHHDPSEALNQHQLGALTRAALAKLSLDHQEVLRLAFYEELSYEEIGKLVHIPVNTVKTRVYYAKQQLRRELERLQVEQQLP